MTARIFSLIYGPGLGDVVRQFLSVQATRLLYGESNARLVVGFVRPTKDQERCLPFYPYLDHVFSEEECSPWNIGRCVWNRIPEFSEEERLDLGKPRYHLPMGYNVCQDHVIDRALMKVPDHMVNELTDQLAAQGLDLSRWYACIHVKQDGYLGKRKTTVQTHERSIRDIARYHELVRHIIVNQGGQVVRMGDPYSNPFPEVPGFVDLAKVPDSLHLQAFAVSRARYFVATDSGPFAIARGFNIPTILSNSLVGFNTTDGALRHSANNILATQIFELEDGRLVRDREAYESGITRNEQLIRDPSKHRELELSDLVKAADIMFERTRHNTVPVQQPLAQPTNILSTNRYPRWAGPTTRFRYFFLTDPDIENSFELPEFRAEPDKDSVLDRWMMRLPDQIKADLDPDRLSQITIEMDSWLAAKRPMTIEPKMLPAVIALLTVLAEDASLARDVESSKTYNELLRGCFTQLSHHYSEHDHPRAGFTE